jgi:hypothetical protein
MLAERRVQTEFAGFLIGIVWSKSLQGAGSVILGPEIGAIIAPGFGGTTPSTIPGTQDRRCQFIEESSSKQFQPKSY